jgi:hypothetical protein
MAKGPQKRKKNPGVGIDFKRAKHKVGRAVSKGPNDTSVAFRSHAINLPSQSVAEDRTGVAVSSHNLTLKVSVLSYPTRLSCPTLAYLTRLYYHSLHVYARQAITLFPKQQIGLKY